jgi:hypothetical protein
LVVASSVGRLVGLALAVALSSSAAAAGTVDPADYRQFWLWKPRPDIGLDHAETLYLLQGHVGAGGFTHQGIAPAALAGRSIYLVYRLERLDWNAVLLASIVNQIQAWEHAGNRIAGIQLDFDARTPRLADYAGFLRTVRRDLPQPYRVSVTGLLDWSTGGSPEAFDVMAGTVDEIVFQTYQARRTIANYREYLPAISRLHVPFKIGLVEDGVWDAADEQRLAASPFYRGAVVFLISRH